MHAGEITYTRDVKPALCPVWFSPTFNDHFHFSTSCIQLYTQSHLLTITGCITFYHQFLPLFVFINLSFYGTSGFILIGNWQLICVARGLQRSITYIFIVIYITIAKQLFNSTQHPAVIAHFVAGSVPSFGVILQQRLYGFTMMIVPVCSVLYVQFQFFCCSCSQLFCMYMQGTRGRMAFRNLQSRILSGILESQESVDFNILLVVVPYITNHAMCIFLIW